MKKNFRFITYMMFFIMVVSVVILVCSVIGILFISLFYGHATTSLNLLNNIRHFFTGVILGTAIIGMLLSHLMCKWEY